MIKDIITNQSVPNAILYQRCLPFDFDSKEPTLTGETVGEQDRATAAEVITDLLDTAELHRSQCLGLSANQIGHPYRAFVMRSPESGRFMPVLNPVVISTGGGVKALYERCLSRVDEKGDFLPGIRMRRPKRIDVNFFDILTMSIVRETFKGMEARVFLHELDHLNGKDI